MPKRLSDLSPALAAQADYLLSSDGVPGASIAVVVNDVGYHHAYGVKSVNGAEPITANTSFNIGSCSKAFGSTMMAALVADGLADWDDPISKTVPEFQLYDEWITKNASLRDLSGNRLGLPRTGFCEFGFDPEISAEYIFEHLKYTQPVAPFRGRFTYVNAGHTAVGTAAARIAGKPFIEALRDRILGPLGMTQTSGGAQAKQDLTDLAAWHVKDGDKAVEIDSVYTDQYLPTGCMCVSGRDAVQWLRFHLNHGLVDGKQIVPAEAVAQTHKPLSVGTPGKDIISIIYPGAHMAAYCLGWATADFEGHHMVQHSGSDMGVNSMTLMFPEKGIGIAVYCNLNPSSGMITAYTLAAQLLGLPTRDWAAYFASFAPKPAADTATPAKTMPVDNPELYVGTYHHPADGALEIRNTEKGLECDFKLGNKLDCEMHYLGEHAFELHLKDVAWRAMARGKWPKLTFEIKSKKAVTAAFRMMDADRVFIAKT